MNDTTTKTTMRELLARWAEVEPNLCEEFPRVFTIRTAAGYINRVCDNPIGFSDFHLSWIQWAVQQAIVARGWAFELSYYSILGSYGAEIDIDSHRSVNRPGSSPTEALLTAYLRALEYGPLEATK